MKNKLFFTATIIFIISGIMLINSPRSWAQNQPFYSNFPFNTGSLNFFPFQNQFFQPSSLFPRYPTFPTQYYNYPFNTYQPFTGFASPFTGGAFSPYRSFSQFFSTPYQYSFYPSFPGFPGYYRPFLPYQPPPPTPQRSVPDVVGETQADAQDDIIAADLLVGNITLAYDLNVEAGYVISQSPPEGRTVSINSVVNLVISRGPQMAVALELVATGFSAPVGLVSPDDGSERLFIVDQTGEVKILNSDLEVLEDPFLDISDNLGTLSDDYDERGLLSMAFDPNYETTGRLFVYYSAPLRSGAPFGWNHTSRISEFAVDPNDSNRVDPNSEDILLQVDQPQSNHNGGQLVFGPEDGLLYISLGDGGGANDTGTGHNSQIGNGQDIVNQFTDVLGSILRIDINDTDPPLKYEIPSSNPFVGEIQRGEIFAFGFRNPFRMSFDQGGDHELFVADAGQNLWEEVNIVEEGENYGWNIKEGIHCFDRANPDVSPSSCRSTGFTFNLPLRDPIIEYRNANAQGGIGRAVIGGFVYRGSMLPDFYARYVFGDWSATGDPDGTLFIAMPPPEEGVLWPYGEIQVASSEDNRLNEYVRAFGQDSNGEVYVLTSESSGPSGETGRVYRMVPVSGEVPFVNVYDQTIYPSDRVKVAAAAYDSAGWIVIHDSTTEIIGWEALTPGMNTDITVNLSRDAEDDETLHAMLRRDANIMGTFEFPGADTPVVGDRGMIVVRPFTVTLCTNPVIPAVVGMTLADAEEEITSCNLEIGNISFEYSNTVLPNIILGQTPAPGTTVPAGSVVNLLVSLGSVSFSANIQPIFNSACIGCHRTGQFATFLPLTQGTSTPYQSYTNLVNVPSTRTGSLTEDLVEPGDSSASVLYKRISGIGLPFNESLMPLGGPPLNQQAQNLIKTWIDEGAVDN